MCRQTTTRYSCDHEANQSHQPCDDPTRPGTSDRSSHVIEKVVGKIHDSPCPACRPRIDSDAIITKGSNHQRLKDWVKGKLGGCFAIDEGESIEKLHGSGSKGGKESRGKKRSLRKGDRKREWLGERGPTEYGTHRGNGSKRGGVKGQRLSC